MTEIDKEREYFNNYKIIVFDSNYEKELYKEANPDFDNDKNTEERVEFVEKRDNLSVERIIEIFLCKDWFDKMNIDNVILQLRIILGTLDKMIKYPTDFTGNITNEYFYIYHILHAILERFLDMNKDYKRDNYKWNFSIPYFFKNKTLELLNHYKALKKTIEEEAVNQEKINKVKEEEQHKLLMKKKINDYHKEKRPCSNCNKLVSVSNMATHRRSDSCIHFSKNEEKEEKPIKTRTEYMNEKLPCQFCNKLVSRSNMPKHNKTDSCITIRNILLTTNKDKDIDLEI
jgi:hypothetical protein